MNDLPGTYYFKLESGGKVVSGDVTITDNVKDEPVPMIARYLIRLIADDLPAIMDGDVFSLKVKRLRKPNKKGRK